MEVRDRGRDRAWRTLRVSLLAALLVCCGCLAVQRAHAETQPPETCPVPPPGARAVASAASTPIQPSLQPPPAEVLVCVKSLPITGAAFTHWAEVARTSEGPAAKHSASAREVAVQVLGFLISSDWVIEEARALHIHVSAGTVRRSFERIRAQQFRKPGEFGAFLKSSGQTAGDLLFRVRLNLLSERVQRHVLAGAGGVSAKERALARFVRNFKRRWQARTYCSPEYAVVDCGRVVSPPL
jgi:hypothetical protein